MDVGGSLKRIEAVLRHFTLEQLVDIVPDFQILSWQNVRRKIIQEELPLNKNSIIRVLVFAVKQHVRRNETYATEILQIIRLRDIAVHHYRYRWIAFMMSGETKQGTRKRYYTCSEIQDCTETIFYRKKRLVEVAVIDQEEMYFISLMERKHTGNRRLVYKAPIFVAHFPGHPYFFISQSGKKEDILHVISRVLGYTGAQDCSLSGQNVRHLLRFLKNRESDAASAQDVLRGIGEYIHAFDETEKGTDFTQRNARLEVADSCFGRELMLPQLTVQCSACQWMVGDIVPDTEGKSFGSMEVLFKSPDILKMLKEMTVKGIISIPPPAYISSLLTKGKNDIKLECRENGEVSVRI